MKANNHNETKMKKDLSSKKEKVEMETIFVSFIDESIENVLVANAELIKALAAFQKLTKEDLAQLKHDYLTEKEQAE